MKPLPHLVVALGLEELHGGADTEVGVVEVEGGDDGEVGVLQRGHASRPDHELVMLYGSDQLFYFLAFFLIHKHASGCMILKSGPLARRHRCWRRAYTSRHHRFWRLGRGHVDGEDADMAANLAPWILASSSAPWMAP